MKFLETISIPKLVNTMSLLGAVVLGLTACNKVLSMDIVRYADKATYLVDEKALKTVDRTFYGAFRLGEWRYKGVNANIGEVNVYIQIPQALNMNDDVQERYLQQVICPRGDNLEMWHQLRQVDLNIHIYTHSKNRSVSAVCLNPLKAEAFSQA